MKYLIILFILTLALVTSAQTTIELKYNNFKVLGVGDTVFIKANSKIIIDYTGLVISSEDERVNSFLVPNSQFDNMNVRIFKDTGFKLDSDDTSSTAIIYQSINYPHQILINMNQGIRDTLEIRKKDKTGIIFFNE
jgi:hypothetical protein